LAKSRLRLPAVPFSHLRFPLSSPFCALRTDDIVDARVSTCPTSRATPPPRPFFPFAVDFFFLFFFFRAAPLSCTRYGKRDEVQSSRNSDYPMWAAFSTLSSLFSLLQTFFFSFPFLFSPPKQPNGEVYSSDRMEGLAGSSPFFLYDDFFFLPLPSGFPVITRWPGSGTAGLFFPFRSPFFFVAKRE